MSEDLVKDDNTEGSKETVLTLVISLNAVTGGINVNGPINDRVLCYGILEMAKDAIRKHNEAKVIPLNGNHRIMDFIRGGKK